MSKIFNNWSVIFSEKCNMKSEKTVTIEDIIEGIFENALWQPYSSNQYKLIPTSVT